MKAAEDKAVAEFHESRKVLQKLGGEAHLLRIRDPPASPEEIAEAEASEKAYLDVHMSIVDNARAFPGFQRWSYGNQLARMQRFVKEQKQLEAERKDDLEFERKKREEEKEQRSRNHCLGCGSRNFTDAQLRSHQQSCKRLEELPLDRFGLHPGEEPESPTLQRLKKQEIQNGAWKYFQKFTGRVVASPDVCSSSELFSVMLLLNRFILLRHLRMSTVTSFQRRNRQGDLTQKMLLVLAEKDHEQ